MSPEREWTFRIEHIVDAIEKIQRYTADMTFEQFAADELSDRRLVIESIRWAEPYIQDVTKS